MLLNAEKLVRKTRRHLLDIAGQQQGNTWTEAQILEALNEEQDGLVADVVQSNEDWYGVVKDIDSVAGQAIYPLFDGFLMLRYLEFGGNGSSDPNYYGAIENRLIEGITGGQGGSAQATDSEYFYAIWGDSFHVQPTVGQSISAFGRAWFIRAPGPILLETIASSPAADKIRFSTTGEAPWEDDVMEGTIIDVVAGTGLGQRRAIIAWDGDTREATVSAAFSPVLDSTSKIATISRVPAQFHTLLHYGAGIRLMVDLKEDARGLAALYEDRMDRFIDFVERRNHAQRGIIPYDTDDLSD